MHGRTDTARCLRLPSAASAAARSHRGQSARGYRTGDTGRAARSSARPRGGREHRARGLDAAPAAPARSGFPRRRAGGVGLSAADLLFQPDRGAFRAGHFLRRQADRCPDADRGCISRPGAGFGGADRGGLLRLDALNGPDSAVLRENPQNVAADRLRRDDRLYLQRSDRVCRDLCRRCQHRESP